MKNPTTRDLFAYWNERRGKRLAPERADIEPNSIRHVLGDSFFLAADPVGNFPFRLAGTRLCALFGRELKNDSFLNLWGQAEQVTMRKLISAVIEEKVGVVAHATARTTDGSPFVVNLELLLLPLHERRPMDARVLGALVPMSVPFWFGARVLGPLELGMLRHVGPTVDKGANPQLVSAAKDMPETVRPFQPANGSLAALGLSVSPGLLRRTAPAALPAGGQVKHRFVVYEGGRTD